MAEDIFCKIVKGDIPAFKIWENDNFLAFLDVNPIRIGHALLIPKEHHDYLFEYSEPEYSEIFKIAKYLAPFIQNATGAERIGLAVEGFGVAHLHLHLVPIDGVGGLDPNKQHSESQENLEIMAQKIREEIK